MQRWSPEVIRYLHTAADRSRYYTDLARELGAFLHPEDRVCDAGCGLGLLSRALLPYCGHVTAIDRSPAAIADLTARGHDPRLTALTGDIRDLPPQKPYDAMVFCLFGGTEEILDIAARQCGGTALVVRRDFRQHQFSSGVRMAGHTAADMEQELRRRRLTCTLRRFTLEFGQPFRSVEDALAFFRLYSRDGTGACPAGAGGPAGAVPLAGLSPVSAQSQAPVPAGHPGGSAEGGSPWIKYSSAAPRGWGKAPSSGG